MKNFFCIKNSQNTQVQHEAKKLSTPKIPPMESYFTIIKKVFFIMGFDFDGKHEKNLVTSNCLKLVRYFNIICLVIATMQCCVYFVSGNLNDVGTLGSGAFGIYSIQTIIKVVVYLFMNEKMCKLSTDVQDTYKKFQSSEENENFFRKIYKIYPKIFYFNIFNLGFYSFIGFVKIIVGFITHTQIGAVFPYQAYWPFDPYEYLPWTLFFNAYTNIMTDYVSMICEQLFVFIVAHMVVSFERLEYDFGEIIEEINVKPSSIIKKKLAKCIDLHNELIEHSKTTNSLFGVPLFGFLIQSYFTICYLEFLATYSFSDFALLSVFALVNVFIQIFMLAYAAEIMKEKALKISDKLLACADKKIDRSLAKYFILIIQVANRPLNLTALGLFTINLPTLTLIINTAFSYFAFLRQFYKG